MSEPNDLYTSIENAKMLMMEENGIVVHWLSGLCPVQGDGWVDGHAFYFRARGDEWGMSITPEITLDVDAAVANEDTWDYYERYGEVPDAGYMPFIEALGFIEQAANQFRSERLK